MNKKKKEANPLIANFLYTLLVSVGLRAVKVALVTVVSVVVIFHLFIITFFNLDQTKQWLLDKVNDNYLSPMGLEVSFNSLNVSILSFQLHLHGTALHVLPRKVKKQDISPKTTPLFINKVSVGFSPFRFWTSGDIYLSSMNISGLKLDIVSQIELEHLRSLLKLGAEEEPVDPEEKNYSDLIFSYFPKSFNIHKSHIRFSLPENFFHLKSTIELLSLKKSNPLTQSPFFAVLAHTRDNYILHPSLDAPADLSRLTVAGNVNARGNGELERLSLVFRKTKVDTTGTFTLSPDFTELKDYKVRSQADIVFFEVLNLVGIDAEGSGILNVTATPESPNNIEPHITGEFSWKNFFMEDFALYTGKSDIDYRARNLALYRTKASLPQRNAYVSAEGNFKIGGEYPYSVKADLHNVHFAQLLQGLTVNDSPVNFNLNARSARFSGLILPKKTKPIDRFSVNVKANVAVKDFVAPGITDKVILEKCSVKLKLFSDASYLELKSSTLSCPDELGNKNKLALDKGKLHYKFPKETLIKIRSNQFNYALLQPLVEEDISGLGSFEASITESTEDTFLKASFSGEGGRFMGVHIDKFKAKLDVDKSGLKFSNGTLISSDKTHKLGLDLTELFIPFNEAPWRVTASIAGNLSLLNKIASPKAPAFEGIMGKVKKLSVDAKFLPKERQLITLKLDTKASQVKLWAYYMEKIDVSLQCAQNKCENSHANILGIYNHRQMLPYAPGQVKAEIKGFGEEHKDIIVSATRVPVIVPQESGRAMTTALLDGEFLSGRFQQEGWAKAILTLTHISLKGVELQPIILTATMASHSSPVNTSVELQDGEIVGNITFPNPFRSSFVGTSASGTIAFQNYEPLRHFQNSKFNTLSLFTHLSGFIQVNYDFNQSKQWHDDLTVYGEFSDLNIFVNKFLIKNRNKIILQKNKHILSFVNDANIGFLDSTLKFNSYYDFNLADFGFSVKGKSDLSPIIEDLFPSTVIDIKTEVNIVGRNVIKNPVFSGFLQLRGDRAGINAFSSHYTDLEALAVFKGNQLELQKFSAKKGEGSIRATGSLSFASLFQRQFDLPIFNLDLIGDNVPVRVKIPVFERFSGTITGRASLKSQGSFPLLLTGNTVMERATISKKIPCNSIVLDQLFNKKFRGEVVKEPIVKFIQFNIKAPQSLVMRTDCLKGRFNVDLTLGGDNENPLLRGRAQVLNGVVSWQDRRFFLQTAGFTYNNQPPNNPLVEVKANTTVKLNQLALSGLSRSQEVYDVTITYKGHLQETDAVFNLEANPPVSPSGAALTKQDIISMLWTGRLSTTGDSSLVNQSFSQNLSPLASFLGFKRRIQQPGVSFLEDVDMDFGISPALSDTGNVTLKALARWIMGDTFVVDLEYVTEDNQASLTGNWKLSDTVSAQGGYSSKGSDERESELLGGLIFHFSTGKSQ